MEKLHGLSAQYVTLVAAIIRTQRYEVTEEKTMAYRAPTEIIKQQDSSLVARPARINP